MGAGRRGAAEKCCRRDRWRDGAEVQHLSIIGIVNERRVEAGAEHRLVGK